MTLAGLAPDLDGLTIVAGQDAYGEWHHVLTHGLFSAVLISAGLTAFAREKAKVAWLSLLAFHLHLFCDLLGSGVQWGIRYFWPFDRTWEVGFRYGWELQSWQNSLIGLLATLGCLSCAKWLGRTPVELFSLSADAKVVKAIRARFGT